MPIAFFFFFFKLKFRSPAGLIRCVGLAPGALLRYLLQSGGLLDAIPTKTPVFPHQFLVSCTLSIRQFFQVCRTIFGSTDLALKIFLFVRMLSIFSLALMVCNGFRIASGIFLGRRSMLLPVRILFSILVRNICAVKMLRLIFGNTALT
jgi:hypothetical protein